MLHTLRIGVRIGSADPFWVQAREAVHRRAQHQAIDLVPIDLGHSSALSGAAGADLIEELVAQDLSALICTYLPDKLVSQILSYGIPVVHLTETSARHPLLVSAHGFYEIAQTVGSYLAERLDGHGHVLAVGGLLAPGGEDGRSRIAGISDALRAYPQLHLCHIPSAWRYEHAYPQIEAALQAYDGPISAIFGLSDSLALAARDAGRALGRVDQRTLVVGINGDPLALAAIADGSMTATIDTPAAEFGIQAVDLACAAARREPLPSHFGYAPRLVTSANVAEVAVQKLIAIAQLPSRLVGVNREQEQQRLAQLETSLAINRRIGSILNRQKLSDEIAELIRANYGFDTVQLFLWHEQEQTLILNQPGGARLPLSRSGLLGHAILRNEPVFVPDMRHSQRFPPDPAWPDTRSRVVVPIRLGGAILGLLDLHSRGATQHSRQSLAGLQVLADQLGIAMRNAELYDDALKALAASEQADQLKTRLLANVSHEFRAPLNVILGYSQAALASPNPYGAELQPETLRDFRHIYRSGQHLMRLINDLLDLSRAEIDQLDLFPETIATRAFLEEVFQSATERRPERNVTYRLELPERLPLLQADQVRLRQVLLNLLDNAQRYTPSGRVTLGAEVAAPHLHIWVEDTGVGIGPELRERIFEPFVTGRQGEHRPQGVGLGLAITRRLVALHGGAITLESQPGHGSTFHVYLPLPSLSGQPARPHGGERAALLVIGRDPSPTIAELCQRGGLVAHRLRPDDDLAALLASVQPAAVAWDLRGAAPAEWLLLQQLRDHPQVCQAPFLLYDAGLAEGEAAGGAIGLLSKPLSGSHLVDTIEALRTPEAAGPILIVDDDPQTRELYLRLVGQALPHLPARAVEGGRPALELIERETPSVVILDLLMPEIDGFAVLRRLRADERTRHVPVIVISGQQLGLEEIKRLDYALVTFHSKGILTADETAAALRGALDGREWLAPQTSLLVKRAIAYLQQHSARDLSRQELAAAVGVSENYLTHIFREELNISPWEYLSRYRIKQAKTLLQSTRASIASIAAEVGFADASYFGRVFRKQVGCSPQAYRDQV